MSEEAIALYFLFGAFFTILEHRSFDFDFTEMSKKGVALNIVQQLTHYTRYMLTWPLYILEDIIIYLDNLGVEDND